MDPRDCDAMSHVRMYAKGEVIEGDNWARVTGSGSVRSNDVELERALAQDFGGCVDRTAEIAYDAQVRSRR